MAENDTQRAVLAIMPKISSSLSLIGSVWIITEVAAHRVKREQVYHRILVAMSVYDVMESIWNFASTWPIPEDTEGIHHPLGTTGTCTSQGFFLQLGLAIPIYNAWLSFYYYLFAARQMTENQIQQSHWELIMHSTAFAIAFGTAISAVFLDLFNNANLWCWIAPKPAGCDQDSRVPCERGNNAHIYRWAFYFGPLWGCLLAAFVFVVALYVKVRELERGANDRPFRSPDSFEESTKGFEEVGTETNNESSKSERENHAAISTANRGQIKREAKSITRVMDQCLWYLVAFYATHLFSTINRVLQLARGSTYYPLLLCHSIMDPLQGFLNFLVYRRPLYMRYRRLRPNFSRLRCWLLAMRWSFTFDDDKERRQALFSKQARQIEEERERKRLEIERQAAAAADEKEREDKNGEDAQAPRDPMPCSDESSRLSKIVGGREDTCQLQELDDEDYGPEIKKMAPLYNDSNGQSEEPEQTKKEDVVDLESRPSEEFSSKEQVSPLYTDDADTNFSDVVW